MSSQDSTVLSEIPTAIVETGEATRVSIKAVSAKSLNENNQDALNQVNITKSSRVSLNNEINEKIPVIDITVDKPVDEPKLKTSSSVKSLTADIELKHSKSQGSSNRTSEVKQEVSKSESQTSIKDEKKNSDANLSTGAKEEKRLSDINLNPAAKEEKRSNVIVANVPKEETKTSEVKTDGASLPSKRVSDVKQDMVKSESTPLAATLSPVNETGKSPRISQRINEHVSNTGLDTLKSLEVVQPITIIEEPKKSSIKEMQKKLQESQSAPVLEKVKLEPSNNVRNMQNKINLPGQQPVAGDRPKTFAGQVPSNNSSDAPTPKAELEGLQQRSINASGDTTSKFASQLNTKLVLPTGLPGQQSPATPTVELPDIKITTEKKSKGFLGMGKKTIAAEIEDLTLEDEDGKPVQESETFHKYIDNVESFKPEIVTEWGPDFEGHIFKITRGLTDGRQLKALKWNSYFIQVSQGFVFFFPEQATKKKPAKSVGILDIRTIFVQRKFSKAGKEVITVYNDSGFQIYLTVEKDETLTPLFEALEKNTTSFNENPAPAELIAFFPKKEKKGPAGGAQSSLMAVVKMEEENKRLREEEEKRLEEVRKKKEEDAQATVKKRGTMFSTSSEAPSEPEREPVYFGVPIENLTTKKQRKVPLLVEKCFQIVEQKGTDVVGIYRLSGNSDEIKKIKIMIEDSPDLFPDFNHALLADVNNVTGLFKLFLRQLPNPLIPFSDYNKFIEILSIL